MQWIVEEQHSVSTTEQQKKLICNTIFWMASTTECKYHIAFASYNRHYWFNFWGDPASPVPSSYHHGD